MMGEFCSFCLHRGGEECVREQKQNEKQQQKTLEE